MKKKAYIWILLLSLLIAASVCILGGSHSIQDISQKYLNADGTVLYMDSKGILRHLDKTGKIIKQIKMPREEEGQELEYRAIASDETGNIYVYVWAFEENGLTKQWIKQLDKKGNEIQHIFEYDRKEDTSVIVSMQMVDEKLAVIRVGTKQNSLYLDFFDTKTEEVTTKEYTFDEIVFKEILSKVAGFCCTPKGSIYYVDVNNHLYCLDNRSRGQYYYEIKSEDYGEASGLADHIFSDSKGVIYYTDIYNMNLMKYNESLDELSVVYTQKEKVGDRLRFEELHEVQVDGDRIFGLLNVRTYGDTGFYIQDGDESYVITEETYNKTMLLFIFVIIWIVSFAALFALWNFIGLGKAHSILVRQLATLIPLLILGFCGLSAGTSYLFAKEMKYNIYEELYMFSQNIAMSIDKEALQNLSFPLEKEQAYDSIGVMEVLFDLEEFQEIFGDEIQKVYYCNIYVTRDGEDYLFFTLDKDSISSNRGKNRLDMESNMQILEQESEEYSTVKFERVESDGEQSLYCDYGILDDTGKVIGRVELGIEYNYFRDSIKQIMIHFMLILLLAFVVLVVILSIQTRRNLRGLSKLRDGVYDISEGHWGTVVDIRSNDEIEEIANAFNRMSAEIGSYMEYIESINFAYEKFVSKETLQLLDKKSVADISIGDYVNREMTILSVNIENIYHLNEAMTAEETFSFRNVLYQNMVLEVVLSQGNIEKYTDDGLRVLYQNDVEDSLECALKILERIDNLQSGIEMSIVLQKGGVMYGIAGTEEKAEAVAVSEILNYTYILKEMARVNSIRLLITAPVYHAIQNKEEYNIRYIGKIKSRRTKNTFLDLYDVLDGYTVDEKIRKKSTKELFQKGVLLFQMGELREARKAFIDVLRNDSSDGLAQSYLLLCDRFIQEFPQNWEGYFS